MKNDVYTLMTAFESLDDARLRLAVGRTLRTAVNRWTFGEKHKSNSVLTDREIEHLKAGQKLDAVREVRNRLGLSLWESKKYVEKHMGPYYNAPVSNY